MNALDLESREHAQAPANAFGWGATEFEFKLQDDKKSAPIKMLARSGDALAHWYWGRIVHDFAGMQHREAIPIDYEHFTSDPIGVVNTFEVEDGNLYLSGSIESIEEGDQAHKLMLKRERNIPYQASIYFDPEELSLEYIPEGMSVEVNARTMEGPLVVARQWQLRGVAVTPHGYDVNTESMFSAPAGAFSLNWRSNEMTKTTAKPADDKAAKDQGELSTEPTKVAPVVAPEVRPTEPTELTSDVPDYRKQAAMFGEKFGNEAGFGYFSDGLTLEQAALKHVEVQDTRIAELTAERDQARQQLAAAELKHGEPKAIDTGTPASNAKAGGFAGLFKQQGAA